MAMKGKSGRKPLRDMSNKDVGRGSSKSRITPQEEKENCNASRVDEEDHPLDRLLLVHSDLSSLIQQIDEIVAQTVKLEETSIQGKEEIVSFTNVLSEMLSSLKPWVPRLKNINTCAAKEAKNEAKDSPDQIKRKPLISPSPLVSWRENCTIERGRQLFLLTPLPISKSLSSKSQIPSKLAFDSHRETIVSNQTPSKPSDSHLTKLLTSPQLFPTKYCSMVVVTPCSKMSPPKSCVLLEPISESSHKFTNRPYKSTPFPLGFRQYLAEQIAGSSSSDTSDGLASNYPEISGIQMANREGKKKKEVEDSPDWLLSPPKTCVLLELADEDSQDIATHLPRSLNQHSNAILMENSFQHFGSNNVVKCQGVESSPMEEKESMRRAGKHPGENTLKKELWTKMEEASSKSYRFNVSTVKKSAGKGFLDLLDEASSSEEETHMLDSR